MAIGPNAVAEEIREKLENMNARDKWAFGPLLLRAAEALAKPASSPAGGDVDDWEAILRYCEKEWQSERSVMVGKIVDLRAQLAALSPSTSAAEPVAEIERDPDDHSREYIPLPGGWEVQTKGAGSTYRLLDKKTGERHAILNGKDWQPLQAFFTRFAREVHRASTVSAEKAA